MSCGIEFLCGDLLSLWDMKFPVESAGVLYSSSDPMFGMATAGARRAVEPVMSFFTMGSTATLTLAALGVLFVLRFIGHQN